MNYASVSKITDRPWKVRTHTRDFDGQPRLTLYSDNIYVSLDQATANTMTLDMVRAMYEGGYMDDDTAREIALLSGSVIDAKEAE